MPTSENVARTDFWDGPTIWFLPASHELLLSAFGPNGHGSMRRGMDDAVAVVAGLAADEFNRVSARAHTRNERIGLLGLGERERRGLSLR